MAKPKQSDKKLFLIAGALLSVPAIYWFFVDGWNPGSNKVKVLVTGVQALVGIYLIFYGVKKTKMKN